MSSHVALHSPSTPSARLAAIGHSGKNSGAGRVKKKSPSPTDRHVGARVRMRRMILGMSQEKLGNALGLTSQQVQKYEKGTNRIGASRLQQIAAALKVEVAFFFEGAPAAAIAGRSAGAAPPSGYVDDFLASSDGLALTKAFQGIGSAPLRRSIVRMVENIASEAKGRA